MSVVVKHRRGTAAQHASFTGDQSEITHDTTNNRLVVHDGTTAGGIPLARKDEAAPFVSPAFTGIPTAPTATTNTNTTQLATTAFVQAVVAALVASAPATLDTLKELADALGDDPNFATTMTAALAGKQATITGAATTITATNLTASRAVVSDGSGKVAISAVTATELGYLSGVTSAIQPQLGTKAPIASPAFTGTIDYGSVP